MPLQHSKSELCSQAKKVAWEPEGREKGELKASQKQKRGQTYG
jgi:hypothetical protein